MRATILAALQLCALPCATAQVVVPTPAAVENGIALVPLSRNFTLTQEVQVATQANPNTANPYAYWKQVDIVPFLHYNGIRHLILSTSFSYNQYFAVPGTSLYQHPEWGFTAMGNVTQRTAGASFYEQFRFEVKNFPVPDGQWTHVPRVRARLGQNIYTGKENSRFKNQFIGMYEEVIFRFPNSSYSAENFDLARFFAGYGFQLGDRTHCLFGFVGQGQLSASGSTLTFYFGPSITVMYHFTKRIVHEDFRRTTAFRNSGVD